MAEISVVTKTRNDPQRPTTIPQRSHNDPQRASNDRGRSQNDPRKEYQNFTFEFFSKIKLSVRGRINSFTATKEDFITCFEGQGCLNRVMNEYLAYMFTYSTNEVRFSLLTLVYDHTTLGEHRFSSDHRRAGLVLGWVTAWEYPVL